MSATYNPQEHILIDRRDGFRVTVNTAHSLVATAISIGVPVEEMPWIDEALSTLAKVQSELGCSQDEALEIINAGGSWAFLERDTDN